MNPISRPLTSMPIYCNMQFSTSTFNALDAKTSWLTPFQKLKMAKNNKIAFGYG